MVILLLIYSITILSTNLLIHYRDHYMSIKKIKETYELAEKFHLKEVSSEEVKKVNKVFEQEKINHQFLYSSESSD